MPLHMALSSVLKIFACGSVKPHQTTKLLGTGGTLLVARFPIDRMGLHR